MKTMQEKKQALIDYETRHCEEVIRKINELPDIDMDQLTLASPWGDVSLWADVNNVDELSDLLHELRLKMGEYKLDSYWIPYSQRVMTKYVFGKTRVTIGIDTTDENAVIKHLSNGKCKVEHELTKRVVCDL